MHGAFSIPRKALNRSKLPSWDMDPPQFRCHELQRATPASHGAKLLVAAIAMAAHRDRHLATLLLWCEDDSSTDSVQIGPRSLSLKLMVTSTFSCENIVNHVQRDLPKLFSGQWSQKIEGCCTWS